MKTLARSFIWWPKIDQDIENMSKSCELCLKTADNPPKANLHVWEWPQEPKLRIHADFLGPVDGKMYLIVIDAFSKWIDVKELKNITADSTISAMREYISTWGIPLRLITDNGPTFCSNQFNTFCTQLGIQHTSTAPYHPASNGAAENAVRTFKNKFKILLKEGYAKHEALCKFLFYYRATPHCTTGVSPAELQIGRKFRSKLDLIRPNLRDEVEKKQEAQRRFFKGRRLVNFEINDVVMVRDYSGRNWRKARILEKLTPVTYPVKTENEQLWKRHSDQIRRCNLRMSPTKTVNNNVIPKSPITEVPVRDEMTTEPSLFGDALNGSNQEIVKEVNENVNKTSTPVSRQPKIVKPANSPVLRQSTRAIKP